MAQRRHALQTQVNNPCCQHTSTVCTSASHSVHTRRPVHPPDDSDYLMNSKNQRHRHPHPHTHCKQTLGANLMQHGRCHEMHMHSLTWQYSDRAQQGALYIHTTSGSMSGTILCSLLQPAGMAPHGTIHSSMCCPMQASRKAMTCRPSG